MQYNSRAIGQTIRNIRKEKGLSQDVLSGLAGIGRTHLTMIESGSKAANMETLMKLSNAMDMKLSELVQRYESEAEEIDEK